MARNEEAKVEATDEAKPKDRWYILRRRHDIVIQMECEKTLYNERTGEKMRDPKSKHREIEFKDGLYNTNHEDEIAFLDSHMLQGEFAPPAVKYRACTAEEIDKMRQLQEKGIPRKEWQKRLLDVEKAMNAASEG